MWAQNSWSSFDEAVSVKLSIYASISDQTHAKLVIARDTGTPLVRFPQIDCNKLDRR